MTTSDYPDTPAGRPIWLITLADLALLLVGFMVLVQATQHGDRTALAKGIRTGFGAGASATVAARADPPMPVAAAGMTNFAPGSAALPGPTAGLIAWAREATRDPRVTLTVTGSVDGTPADVDATTGSAAILAADRARAVAAALAENHAVPQSRMIISTAPHPGNRLGRRAAMVDLAFAGENR